MKNTLLFISYICIGALCIIPYSFSFAQSSSGTDKEKRYYCTPCGLDCDKEVFHEPGLCKHCGMALLESETSVTDSNAAPHNTQNARREGPAQRTKPRKISHLSRQTVSQIDELFAAYNKKDSPGYGVGIFQNGKVLFKKGYGMANLDYNMPITSATVFNIASLSKQFTAACVALLILRNSLSLEDEVKQYVPEVGKFEHPIQIKHLVYMTSGIPEYYTLPRKNGLNWKMYDYFTVDTAIAASLSQPKLLFEPGTKWSYNNVNYMLLAKVVEKVSGQTFADFAGKNIFSPLGMNHTHVNDDVTLVVKNRATGYIPLDSQMIEDARQAGYYVKSREGYLAAHRNSPHYGGSGIFTTMDDWYLWNQNFYEQKLGGKAFYDLMHQRMPFAHSKTNDAFGLVYSIFNGEPTVGYAGGDAGFNSYVMRFPEQELTVVCFSNVNSSGGAEKFAHQVGNILFKHHVLISTKGQ